MFHQVTGIYVSKVQWMPVSVKNMHPGVLFHGIGEFETSRR